MQFPQPSELVVSTLGPCRVPSPIRKRGDVFVDEACRVLTCSNTLELQPFLDAGEPPPAFEAAGPRAEIFFEPEVPFALEGNGGFLQVLEQRLKQKRHAVAVVAEGAGQDLLQDPDNQARDASGNLRLKDIGLFIRDEITRYFSAHGVEMTIKYIDPSYVIRSLPANGVDSQYCLLLGQHAVHAGMAGRSDMVVGYWNQSFTHVPIAVAVAHRKMLDPRGEIWQRVLEATGKPASMGVVPAS